MNKEKLLHDVQNQTTHWWNKAKEIYSEFTLKGTPFVNFNLRGKCSGKALLRTQEIRYNRTLLEENYDDFCSRTIPHEVAHLVAYQVYGSRGHDRYWKKVMIDLGCSPSRCHSYDTSNSTVYTLEKNFQYKCKCSTHMLTKIRHNRSQKHGGEGYRCKKCRCNLVYTP